MRWSLSLAKFDFDVEHRPGTKMRHVVALSRHESKSFLKIWFEWSRNVTSSAVLYRQGNQRGGQNISTMMRRKNGVHQLVVPRKLIRGNSLES